MIFTHCGKLGDFFLTLPIANWYYKTHGEKIHYALTDNFIFFRTLIPDFSKHLPYVEKVTLVPHIIDNYGCGGQPYRFNPANYGVEGQYYNIGFRHFPNKYATFFIAEEHGFGVDYEELVDIKPDMTIEKDKVFTNEYNNIAPMINTDEFIELSFESSLAENVAKMMAAKEVRCFMSGFSILCDLLNPLATRIHINKGIEGYGLAFFKNHNHYMANNRYIIF